MLNSATNNSNSSWKSLYPFESKKFRVGSHNLHFVDEGNGQPILFVHGNPTWSFYYRELIKKFRTEFRTIAVDNMGCGFSDKPREYPYQLQQHIKNLVALIDELKISNVTLVAHDWGGAIGIGALLQRQELFKNIVLFNTATFPPPYIPFRIRICRWPVVGKVAVQGFNAFARAAITMATEQKGGLDPAVAAGLLAPYNDWNNRSAINGFVRDIPTSKSHATWGLLQDIENGLAKLKNLPIKLIWGMKDWCFRPECLDRLLTHWPAADVSRIEDAGHYVVEDATDHVCQLLSEFLAKR